MQNEPSQGAHRVWRALRWGAFLALLLAAAVFAGQRLAPDILQPASSSVSGTATPEPSPSPTATPAATPEPSPTPEPHDGITEAERAALDELCAGMPGRFALALVDLETGDRYAYRADDRVFAVQSLLTAPYALWLCLRADAGEIDLTQPIPYPAVYWRQEGPLADCYGQDTADPVTLMTAMIAHSDNEATRVLAAAWPTDEAFPGFLRQELGFSRAESCHLDLAMQGGVTAQDIANAFLALYQYFCSDSAHAALLEEIFVQAGHEILWTPPDTLAAKKYGSWDDAFHDAALIFAPHPYLVVALSGWGDQTVDFPPEAVERMQQTGRLAWTVTQDREPPDDPQEAASSSPGQPAA